MSSIFLSYASPDKAFALRLAKSIKQLGYVVWIDLWEIGIGDSPQSKIGEGIDHTEYMIVVLSKHTLRSSWVERELQIKYCEELTQGRTAILPVMIEDCTIPPFLRPKRFADFRLGYEIGFAQLALTLHTHNGNNLLVSPDFHLDQSDQIPLSSPRSANSFLYNSPMIKTPPKLIEIGVELGVPYIGKITGMWKPDEEEQNAAWELYVELVTRVSAVELQPDEGILRESLSSLYIIFTITRDILHKYGPSIARLKPGSDLSFGHLAINILNLVLRPVLSKWHPLLLSYEHTRERSVSVFEHERRWEKAEELRQVLNDTRLVLVDYMTLLARVADVPQFISK